MMLFLLGAILGTSAVYALYWRAQREATRIEEERLSLLEERGIVLDFMHDMVDAVGERLSREALFQRIVHASILSTGALSACLFERRDDNTLCGIASEGLFPPHHPTTDTDAIKMGSRAKFIEEVLKSEIIPMGEGVVGRVAASGRGELIANAQNDPRIVKHNDPTLVVRSLIAAPIMVRKRLIGVLCVCNSADGLPFTATDYSLVAALAEQAGLTVHNADFINLQVEKQRIDRDLSQASEVQQMLLPREMPRVNGLELDARYLAAQVVSGDLYDVFRLSDTRLGVVVADVSGKGVSASLLMTICRTLLHQIAPKHESPAAALIELNRALAADAGGNMYVTMTYAIVDTGSNQVTIARAGHELPLLTRQREGQGFYSEYVRSEGMPLGLVDETTFAEALADRTVDFQPGDILLLYTDGLTETPNLEEKEFGSSRLVDALRMSHKNEPKAINDSILLSVRQFSGSATLRDDFTLLTVKRG